jgi:SagB-type dehydrogenase family enzyme
MKKNEEKSASRELLISKWDEMDFTKTDQALKIPVPPQEKPFDENGVILDLIPKEKWNIGNVSIVEAIVNRESRRKYTEEHLTIEELSFLLYATQGIKKYSVKHSFRTVPSGGARHSFETYLYINRVRNVPKGVYRYLPIENRLYLEDPYRNGMEEDLDRALRGQFWNAAAYFIWTTIPYRMEWRYAHISPKIIAIDIGHVCQNLYLACEAIHCGTCGIGAFQPELMDKFLKVDGENEFSLYMAPVGKIER